MIDPRAAVSPHAPGLDEPVFDAQRVFRSLLLAFSHPGRIVDLDPLCQPAESLPFSATASLLAILDAETPLWLDPAASGMAGYFRFHCGCPITETPSNARFALIVEPGTMPPLAVFAAGTATEPEESATVLIVCDALCDDPEGWRLSGPGVSGARTLAIRGLPAAFPAWLAANHARFPMGIDVVLCAGPRIAALPRTTRVET